VKAFDSVYELNSGRCRPWIRSSVRQSTLGRGSARQIAGHIEPVDLRAVRGEDRGLHVLDAADPGGDGRPAGATLPPAVTIPKKLDGRGGGVPLAREAIRARNAAQINHDALWTLIRVLLHTRL